MLSVAARGGVRKGYAAAGGVWCGDTVLMTLSAAGVAWLLQANAVLFGVVRYAGAGYLTWLAVGMLRAAWSMWRGRGDRADAVREAAPAAGPVGAVEAAGPAAGAVADRGPGAAGPARAGERPFRRAFVISLLNPKAILFFAAFFVQFVSGSNPAVGFVTLGVLLRMAGVLYLSALIFGGTRLAAVFRRRRTLSAGVTSAAGVLFMGFAAKLSLASA